MSDSTDEIVEQISRTFHVNYEVNAPEVGYTTRQESAVPWDQLPELNRRLMLMTVRAVYDEHIAPLVEEQERLRSALRAIIRSQEGNWPDDVVPLAREALMDQAAGAQDDD